MENTGSSCPGLHSLSYTNNKGKRIVVGITHHARQRFVERWKRVYPDALLASDRSIVDQTIADCFSQAKRVETFGRKIRTRLKRHGKDTLYFRTSHFTFVVQDAALLTVEISDPGKRHLNNRNPTPTPIAAPVAKPSVATPSKPVAPAPSGATSECAIKIPVPSFRLTGIVLLHDGNSKSVNLGTHESLTCRAEPELLTAKPGFADLLRARVQEKCPGAELRGVVIALGKKQEKSLFWRI